MSNISDLIQSVATDKLTDATGSVHELLGQRVLDALDTRKQEIASALFQQEVKPTVEPTEGA